jgi:Flp pilus assembly protein TadD
MPALLVMIGVVLNAAFLEAGIECGTDLPALALALGATLLLVAPGGMRSRFAAGVLAGCAVATRSSHVFLLPAALIVLALRPGRARALAAYAAGALVPLGAWMAFSAALHGDPLHNRNFMNVAYEVYGRGAGWEEFTNQTSDQFRSMADVVRYDPARFFGRIGANVVTRWTRDLRELLPLGIGVFVVPGLIAAWLARRRAANAGAVNGARSADGGRALLLHWALCYLVLAPVFYAPRFSLYLIPFYLTAVALFFLRWPLPERWRTARNAALAALFVAAAVPTTTHVRHVLASAPHETREAGALLHAIARPGDRVMARKPHVAYFAGMDFVALPAVFDLADLAATARASGARYLFFGALERSMRPQFALLADSGVALPGFEPIAYRSLDSAQSFSVYRMTGEVVDAATLRDSVATALMRILARRPGEAWAWVLLADQLVQSGRPADALEVIARAEALAPADPMAARVRSVAHFRLGDFAAAAEAATRSIALGNATSWDHAHLGYCWLALGRYADARRELETAVAAEPARVEYFTGLGIARFHTGDPASAVRLLEQAVAAQPANVDARLYAARAFRALGRADEARAVLAAPGLERIPAIAALADSLRATAAR